MTLSQNDPEFQRVQKPKPSASGTPNSTGQEQGFQPIGASMPRIPTPGTTPVSTTSQSNSGDTGRDLTPSDPQSEIGIAHGKTGSTAITPTGQRPGPETVRDILWKLSTTKLWQIQPDDQKGAAIALKTLAWATIPAQTDEAVFWLTRLLAHFPRRDSAQDAVVIGDLAADMVEANVALVALVATCDDIRKAATRKDPWFPPSGEVLKLAIERTKDYRAMEDRIRNPRQVLAAPTPQAAPVKPWDGIAWADMPHDVKGALWDYVKALGPGIGASYCRVMDYDYEAIRSWAEPTLDQVYCT